MFLAIPNSQLPVGKTKPIQLLSQLRNYGSS